MSYSATLAGCPDCMQEMDQIRKIAEGASEMRVKAPMEIVKRILVEARDCYGSVETDLGHGWVGFSARGITMIGLREPGASAFEKTYRARLGRVPIPSELPDRYTRIVRQAAAGNLQDAPPVDISDLPEFDQHVLQVLQTIPRGEVRPYFWLAREVGRPNAARAVGNAMARNPIPFILPCHRVVPAGGGVGNYGYGPRMKRDLLRKEGVPIDELDELARAGVRYVGSRNTHIFCFPSCRDARGISPANRVPLGSAAEAAATGFRPCKHCRPG